MKLLRVVAVSLAATLTSAVYNGDVIQYWIDQTSLFINGTIIGGLQTPPTAWSLAITSASMYNAAVESQNKSLDFQQIAVSNAAHNTLTWIFHGTRLYPYIDRALKTIRTQILATAGPLNLTEATQAGRQAAREVIISRAGDDGLNNFVDYAFGPPVPGVYQLTISGYGLPPDNPQVPFVNMFATGKPATAYLAPQPPSVNSTSYESFLAYVKAVGASNSTSRTQEQTNIALFWRESAPISFAHDIQGSAKLRAQLNYAMVNAAIAAWVSKWHYNAWRPETALHRTDIWLTSGHNISDPNWQPLLNPTPIEQEYTSGHGTVGGAAAAVLKAFNGGDNVNVNVSSFVAQQPEQVITRHFTNLSAAAQEIGNSRVYGGIHFTFSTDTGVKIGDQVGRDTLNNFDNLWNQF